MLQSFVVTKVSINIYIKFKLRIYTPLTNDPWIPRLNNADPFNTKMHAKTHNPSVPNHRSTCTPGAGVVLTPASGEGSTHTNPNQSADEHVAVPDVDLGAVDAADDGFGVGVAVNVLACLRVSVLGSLQPNQPGFAQVADEAEEDEEDEIVGEMEEVEEVVVTGTSVCVVMVVVCVNVVEPSLQPNQPGVKQLVTVVVLV